MLILLLQLFSCLDTVELDFTPQELCPFLSISPASRVLFLSRYVFQSILVSVIFSLCLSSKPLVAFTIGTKQTTPNEKGPPYPYIWGIWHGMPSVCQVWSCRLHCLFSSLLSIDFFKDGLHQQTRKRLYLTCWVCACMVLSSPVKVCCYCCKRGMTKLYTFGSQGYFTVRLLLTW